MSTAADPRGGRPTKCTPEITARILSYVEQGNYIEIAAAAAGINKTTLYDWLKRGAREAALRDREDTEVPPQRTSRRRTRQLQEREARRAAEESYVRFVAIIEEGMARAEIAMSVRLAKAAKEGAWRADAYRLERLYPKRWGRRSATLDSLDAGAPGAGADEDLDDLRHLSDDDLDEIEALLERGRSA